MNTIGRYEIVERIGSGGFATVYRVRDPVLDSDVAAKVLAENWSGQGDLRDRFIREAQLLRRIDSDRVITVHDIGELASGQPFFVMALLDRGTLDERLLERPPASSTDLRTVATGLAECVRTIHSYGMIHRDIKPSNLLIAGPKPQSTVVAEPGLLGSSERLVMGDFGLAKDIALQATAGLTISAGTGGYAAPEQMAPTGVPDQRTDLYAATGVIYRTVTGTTPPNFDAATETVTFAEAEPSMAGELGRFFREGMAFDQRARHGSIDAWLQDLLAIVDLLEMGTPSPLSNPDSNGHPQLHSQPHPQSLPPQAATPSTAPDQWRPPSQPSPVVPPAHAFEPPPSAQPVHQHLAHPDPVAQPVASPPSSGANPIVYPPTGGPPGQPGGLVGDLPQGLQQQGLQQHGTQQHGGRVHGDPMLGGPTPPQSHRSGRSRTGWLVALSLLVVAAVAAGLYYLSLPAGPEIVGPDVIAAGEQGLFSAEFEGAESFEWTDWNGATKTGDLTVRGIVPGALEFSVVAIGADGSRSPESTHKIEIVEADVGPSIVGPSTVKVNDVEFFEFEAPEGFTDPVWSDSDMDSQPEPGDRYRLEPTGAGTWRINLVMTRVADGELVGTTKQIEIVE